MESYRNLQSNFGRLGHLLICTSYHAESQMLRLDSFKQAAGLPPSYHGKHKPGRPAVSILTWLLLFSANVCLPVCTTFVLFQMYLLFCPVSKHCTDAVLSQSTLLHPFFSSTALSNSSFIAFNYVYMYMYICVGVCVHLCGIFVSAHRS